MVAIAWGNHIKLNVKQTSDIEAILHESGVYVYHAFPLLFPGSRVLHPRSCLVPLGDTLCGACTTAHNPGTGTNKDTLGSAIIVY